MIPPPPEGGWTVESLRLHFTGLIEAVEEHMTALIAANDQRYEQRFVDSQTAVGAALSAARTAVDAALSAAKEAVAKAETASEKRFEGVNEFRATLSDQQRTLMPRAESELRFNAAETRIAKIEQALGERRAQNTGARESWGLIVGAILALIGILTFALRFLPLGK
jgi:hypothetical protein